MSHIIYSQLKNIKEYKFDSDGMASFSENDIDIFKYWDDIATTNALPFNVYSDGNGFTCCVEFGFENWSL